MMNINNKKKKLKLKKNSAAPPSLVVKVTSEGSLGFLMPVLYSVLHKFHSNKISKITFRSFVLHTYKYN